MSLGLDPDRDQRRAADPTASVWVAASAGSGKTKVLADRVLNLLLTGTPPHRVLCLTFTKAAAAEMSNRIAQRLARWAVTTDAELVAEVEKLTGAPPDEATRHTARRLFARVLDAPGGMRIQTVHAFCQSLLGRFPVEARVPPNSRVLDDRDAQTLLIEARDVVLARARQGVDEALAEALGEITERVHESNFPDLMATLTAARGRIRRLLDHHGGIAPTVAAVRERLGVGADDTRASVLARVCDAVDEVKMRRAMAALLAGGTNDVKLGQSLASWLALNAKDRLARWQLYQDVFITPSQGTPRGKMATEKAKQADPAAEDILNAERERIAGVVQHLKAVEIAVATQALLRLGDALIDAFETAKRGRMVMDFDDLILAARRLMEGDGAAAWVLYKLDGGIDHVLIDEAQDTNPEQWDVVRGLTAEFFTAERAPGEAGRTVFAVGDRKQSIYSFQGADPDVFEAMRHDYAAEAGRAGARWSPVDLHVSFRSTRAVLDAVDAVFALDAARHGVVADGEDHRHIAWRRGQGGLVEIWPPVDPLPADDLPSWKPPVERLRGGTPQGRLAALIARRIKAMLDEREVLSSKGRPIRAGDIMVLVRRRGAFVEELARDLKQLGVETSGVDRMVLTEQMPVMDLTALGRFLLLPGDDLTLATVLKGPLIGLSEDDLFAVAHGRKGRLWDALGEKARGGEPFAAARAYLAGLLARVDFMTPHDLFAHVLGPLGGRKALVARLGPEAEDPIDEFVNQCLTFERAHAPSLEAFLHWLTNGGVEIKRDLEEAARDAVRIMTVHGAKGLQAPIVFLPDTMQKSRAVSSLLWEGRGPGDVFVWSPRKDDADAFAARLRDAAETARDEEYRRLLYVAMTRAEDRLYVCGWGGGKAAPEDCWYALIRAALAPYAQEVADHPLVDDLGGPVLRLTSAQEAALGDGPSEARRIDRESALPDWVFGAPPAEPSPPRPLAPSKVEGEEPPVRPPLAGEDRARFRRGRLIHRLLQSLPDVPPERRREAGERFLRQAADDLTDGDRAALLAETLAVLAHPDFADLFGPGSKAEVPIVGRLGAHVVSGQVDRLIVTPTAVRIVDFKTNRPPPERIEDVPEVYWRQMAAYQAVIGDVWPGRQVDCLLLWTDTMRLMPLPAKRLNFMAEDLRAGGREKA